MVRRYGLNRLVHRRAGRGHGERIFRRLRRLGGRRHLRRLRSLWRRLLLLWRGLWLRHLRLWTGLSDLLRRFGCCGSARSASVHPLAQRLFVGRWRTHLRQAILVGNHISFGWFDRLHVRTKNECCVLFSLDWHYGSAFGQESRREDERQNDYCVNNK